MFPRIELTEKINEPRYLQEADLGFDKGVCKDLGAYQKFLSLSLWRGGQRPCSAGGQPLPARHPPGPPERW